MTNDEAANLALSLIEDEFKAYEKDEGFPSEVWTGIEGIILEVPQVLLFERSKDYKNLKSNLIVLGASVLETLAYVIKKEEGDTKN